jgi:preprotein translocase subunit SecG
MEFRPALSPNNICMLTILLTLLHVIVCFFLIIVVLLQSGKAADLAGAFGGMGSQTTFGPRGSATILSKATTAAAVIFMITSMWLAILATRHSGTVSSVLDSAKTPKAAAPAPVKGGRPPMPNVNVQQLGGKPVPAPVNPGGAKPAQK